VEKHGGDFALEGAELDHTDRSRPGYDRRSLYWLALEHGGVARLMVCGSGLWRRLLLLWVNIRRTRCWLCWYKSHAICMSGLRNRHRCGHWGGRNGRIRCQWRLVSWGGCMRCARSTRRMGC
jgi:hypothetical protein